MSQIQSNAHNEDDLEITKKRKIEEDDQSDLLNFPQSNPNFTTNPSQASNSLGDGNEIRGRAQRYLQLMNSEQIVQTLLEIVEAIPEAFEKLEEKAHSDPAHRKLFIRGLSYDTTDEQLYASFICYGEIEEAAAVMDRTTGKNKGYGFVIFKDTDSAYSALLEPDKEIGGRMTHCNLASLGHTTTNSSSSSQTQSRGRSNSFGTSPNTQVPSNLGAPQTNEEDIYPRSVENRKIFIRGLDYNTTTDELKSIFSEYGEIDDCLIPTDRNTGKSKGFAFVTFKHTSSATDALHHPVREVNGRTVNVHLATPPQPRGMGGGGSMGYMGGPPMGGPPSFMGPPPGGYMGGPEPPFYGGPMGGPRGILPPRYPYPPY